MYYQTFYQSPTGGMMLVCRDEKLIILKWVDGEKCRKGIIPENMTEKDDCPVFDKTKKWLDRYFGGQKPLISELPLAPIGGEFRQTVWRILCEIPYGEVMTYGDIAKKIGIKSAQAVGGAVGHNPISIIIPCHRVVGSNGNLTGFAAGIKKKIELLELEGVDMSNFFTPKKGTAL